jgi:diacylglycerol kinase family enzyme
MKIAVVYNPVGDPEVVGGVRIALDERGVDAKWIETTEEDPGKGQAADAAAQGFDVVLVAGGDGTVRAAAEGLAETGVHLAIAPAGTGNLLARNLELPEDPDEAVRIALGDCSRDLDIGYVNGEAFTVIAGAGLDAVIMDETSRDAKDRIGVLAYVVQGVKHVFDEPIPATVRIDGGERQDGSWASLMVGNLGRLQGGVDLFPDSRPDDGVLEFLGLSAEKPFDTLVAALQTVSEGARAVRAAGRSIEIQLTNPHPYQLDGEPRDPVRQLDFSVRHRSLIVQCRPQSIEKETP